MKKLISFVYKRLEKYIYLLIIVFMLFYIKNNLSINSYLRHILNSLPSFVNISANAEENEEVIDVFVDDEIIRIDELVSDEPEETVFIPSLNNVEELTTINELEEYLYAVDETAFVNLDILNMKKLMGINITANLTGIDPKILIIHTHSQEDFIDSKKGVIEDTIVGVGNTLSNILSEKYGLNVIHDYGVYDMVDGEPMRDGAYERMEPNVLKILAEYPTIELIIDLHRDGVDDDRLLVTEIDNKQTAQLMLFNGICSLNDNGEQKILEDLPNEFVSENLAASLKLHLYANEKYPNLMRKIYIRPYRYSLHMRPNSILVEAGANTNTVEQVKTSMHYLAEMINNVININPDSN